MKILIKGSNGNEFIVERAGVSYTLTCCDSIPTLDRSNKDKFVWECTVCENRIDKIDKK